jgi:hypothetical protein
MKKAYSIARFDRCGSKVNEDLFVYAHCIKMGYDYVGPKATNWQHEHKLLSSLLNLPIPFGDNLEIKDWVEIRENDYSRDVYEDVNDLIDVDFLEIIRERAESNIRFHTGRINPKISIHIRRGDVSFQSHPQRYIKNEYFLENCRKLLEIFPRCEISIFSETNSSESFADFERLGCRLFLDSDLTLAWREMINSDVLFMSKSSFSYVPAMYNKNLVVYYPAWYQKLNHWISSEDPELWLKLDNFLSERYEK